MKFKVGDMVYGRSQFRKEEYIGKILEIIGDEYGVQWHNIDTKGRIFWWQDHELEHWSDPNQILKDML